MNQLLFITIIVLEAIVCVSSYSKCYKCASQHIQLNWNYYMPIQADSERTIELKGVKCSNETIPEAGIGCQGSCMTLNVTGTYKNEPAFFGTLRDCYSHYFKTPKHLINDRECHVEQIKIRGVYYNAEYCYCNGDYCNGKSPSKGSTRRALISSSSSSTAFTFSNFIFTFLLSLIIVILY